jgi:hypothetical protein
LAVGVVRSRDSYEISLGVSELLARTGVVEEEPEKLAMLFAVAPSRQRAVPREADGSVDG